MFIYRYTHAHPYTCTHIYAYIKHTSKQAHTHTHTSKSYNIMTENITSRKTELTKSSQTESSNAKASLSARAEGLSSEIFTTRCEGDANIRKNTHTHTHTPSLTQHHPLACTAHQYSKTRTPKVRSSTHLCTYTQNTNYRDNMEDKLTLSIEIDGREEPLSSWWHPELESRYPSWSMTS